jgi:hypothetical protein
LWRGIAVALPIICRLLPLIESIFDFFISSHFKTKKGKETKWMVVVAGQGIPLGSILASVLSFQ